MVFRSFYGSFEAIYQSSAITNSVLTFISHGNIDYVIDYIITLVLLVFKNDTLLFHYIKLYNFEAN